MGERYTRPHHCASTNASAIFLDSRLSSFILGCELMRPKPFRWLCKLSGCQTLFLVVLWTCGVGNLVQLHRHCVVAVDVVGAVTIQVDNSSFWQGAISLYHGATGKKSHHRLLPAYAVSGWTAMLPTSHLSSEDYCWATGNLRFTTEGANPTISCLKGEQVCLSDQRNLFSL